MFFRKKKQSADTVEYELHNAGQGSTRYVKRYVVLKVVDKGTEWHQEKEFTYESEAIDWFNRNFDSSFDTLVATTKDNLEVTPQCFDCSYLKRD